jgi:hypothetical protein
MVMSSELIEWRSKDWERVTFGFADGFANRESRTAGRLRPDQPQLEYALGVLVIHLAEDRFRQA